MNSDQDVIRWGISSTGAITEKFVADLALVDDAELVAVGSRSLERATTAARKWEAERAEATGRSSPIRAHGSTAELAADPDVDVIYVASIQTAHADDVLTCLEAGKPVLCEKPFAINRGQADRMVDCAREHSTFLMEAMWSRFQPAYRTLRRLLDESRIGEPVHLDASFSFCVPEERREGNRLFRPEIGGGAFIDLGIYGVHLAHFVFGPPHGVKASARLEGGVDVSTAALLSWNHGATASLHAGITVVGSNQARISGDRGAITLDAMMHVPHRLRLQAEGGHETLDVAPEGMGYQYQVEEVHRCLRAGEVESDVMSWADTLAMIDTLDAVRSQIGLVYPGEQT